MGLRAPWAEAAVQSCSLRARRSPLRAKSWRKDSGGLDPPNARVPTPSGVAVASLHAREPSPFMGMGDAGSLKKCLASDVEKCLRQIDDQSSFYRGTSPSSMGPTETLSIDYPSTHHRCESL